MGRVCAVKDCKSGSADDNKRRDKLGLKKTVLFKVPQSPTKRQQWSEALSTELTEKKYICDLHFHSNDVQESYITNLPNGEINIIQKGRTTRKVEAVPLTLDKQQPLQCLAIRNSLKQIKNIELQEEDEGEEQEDEEEVISEQFNYDEIKIELQTLDPEEEQNCNNFHHAGSSKKTKLPFAHNDISIKRRKCSEDDIDYSRKVSLDNDTAIHNIITELNKCFPIGWCFFPGIKQLTAIQLDRVKFKERIRLVICANRSVTVTYVERRQIKLDVQIQTINDLVNCMKTMGCMLLCAGTGFDKKSYSLNCSGDVTNGYKRCQACPRCPECRKLRLTLQRNEKNNKSETTN